MKWDDVFRKEKEVFRERVFKDKINLSILEVPINLADKLNDAMYLTAKPLYKNINTEWKNLHRIVRSDFRQYSPFEFKNATKKSENWNNDKQNLLILDIDDGLSIDEAKEKFKQYKYFICTTKSHQIEKKGLKCDRFRIILKSDNIPKGDVYFDFIKEVENEFNFIDKQVNTKTGAFLGFGSCEYWFNKGKLFDCSAYIELAEARKQLNQNKSSYNAQNQTKTHQADIDIENIKNKLNREVVANIINSLGFSVNRNFKFKYRAEERTPSATINNNTNPLIKDFGSDLSTDAFGFVQEVKQCSFIEAVDYVSKFV